MTAASALATLRGPVTAAPLTRREHEVTLLAADGMTNREIAERLAVSAKTVENHLTKAYTKLGVSSRAPETPYEYLDRVRATAPSVERQLTTLTRLFEVARFSHHPVTPAMKADAIAAYAVVADESKRAREAAQDDDAAVLT